jgi:hypothetical protein
MTRWLPIGNVYKNKESQKVLFGGDTEVPEGMGSVWKAGVKLGRIPDTGRLKP